MMTNKYVATTFLSSAPTRVQQSHAQSREYAGGGVDHAVRALVEACEAAEHEAYYVL